MNAPDALQNIRSKHPVAYVVLYLFVGWALLVVITHAIAFGAELLITSSDQPTVKWEATDECTDGTRTIYYNSPLQFESSERAALFRCMAIRLSRTGGRWPTAPDGRQPLPRRGPGTCCRRGGRCRGERLNRDVPGPDRATAG